MSHKLKLNVMHTTNIFQLEDQSHDSQTLEVLANWTKFRNSLAVSHHVCM
jgi:hypothetical protein